jgi:hypothetical protein
VRETQDVRPSLPSQRGVGITSLPHQTEHNNNPTLALVEIQYQKKVLAVTYAPLADVSVALPDDEAAVVVPDALLGGSTFDVHLYRISRFPG